MIQKAIISLGLLAGLILVGGFVVLAVWDVPVVKKEIGKPVDISALPRQVKTTGP